MPGTSKATTPMAGSSAATNGAMWSRLTPMPLHSRSGGLPGSPSRRQIRRRWPRTVTIRGPPPVCEFTLSRRQAKAPTPVMSRPTMSVWMDSVPS